MTAFMEARDVGTRHGRCPRGGILQFQLRTKALQQGSFVSLQFLKHQIRNCLFKPHRPVSDYPLRANGTVTDDVASKGGDASMH